MITLMGRCRMSPRIFFVVNVLLLHSISPCLAHSEILYPDEPAKILIWPAEFSHWINLKIIAKSLVERGHEVTVLRSSAYQDFMAETDEFDFINFNVTGIKPGDHLLSMDHVLHLLKLGDGKSSIVQNVRGMIHFWLEQLGMRERQCNSIMTNEKILSELADRSYDLVLADATVFGGELIAHKLGIPFVYTVRTLPAEAQFLFSHTPIPISYVPMINTEYTDRMNFFQRTVNVITYIYQSVGVDLYSYFYMDPLVRKYLGSESSYQKVMKNASMWLIRMDFAFEYPRPLMPNVKFIGGFHCRPAEQLPSDLQAFVEGSGDEGFIVFSMGSMVRNMHKSKANLIASAFAKLKQRVVWRYLGETPDTLGNNTKIMNWLPQNDLLGHPKCKVFVTHGGTNGIYEAIYHGIPMLGLPLLVDQFDNMARIKDRGAGRTLDITKLRDDDLIDTLQDLLKNESYRENAIQLSKLHKDSPLRPLDTATFWIEYAIRHRGAYHLRAAASELWWFQYQLLDVCLFMLSVGVTFILTMKKIVGLCSRRSKAQLLEKETKNRKSFVETKSGFSVKDNNRGLPQNGGDCRKRMKNSKITTSNGNSHLRNGCRH